MFRSVCVRSLCQLRLARPTASTHVFASTPRLHFSTTIQEEGTTHPDFAPKTKTPPEDALQATMESLKQDITENRLVLFMKGVPRAPRCGFSMKVVQILNTYGVKYVTYDVLADPYVHNGIKKISNWPTIPQLYIDGEFIGGCDIITEMHDSGELRSALEAAK
eukprot:NODE_1991_length_680_cov_303.955626_g1555_i0.p1 GENE.NODE_1991_length_680_cov_303.955626_g1555_i0~~NODE_1991_length_680_cov_303.955626_g1555_i0.p1  ORF type:complete len:183 (-),score=60.68 NODE_1991_length_680_cov_303.955626_g1555_i0:131-619(-)